MSDAAADDVAFARLSEASSWLTHLVEHGLSTSPAFEAWLAADPAHRAAWERVRSGWREVGEQANAPELLRFRREALGRAQGNACTTRLSSHRMMALAVSLLLLMVTGVGGLAWWRSSTGQSYQTARGERRTITLDDGSRIALDASTRVDVRFTREHRRLVLVAGQARFDVAHNPLRPFMVEAHGRTVVAIGTAFNIDLLGPTEVVTLIEGRVVITPSTNVLQPLVVGHPPPTDVTLLPGQQAAFRTASRPTLASVDLRRTGAWQSGMLDVDDEPLASVAMRLNRYADRPITVSPGIAQLRISGVFDTADVATFVDAVSHYLPVTATERGSEIVIDAKSSQKISDRKNF